MKRAKFIVLTAAAVLPAASVLLANAGTNLVTNGDFANGVSGWKNFGGNPQPFFGGMVLTNNHAGTGNSYASAYQCITDITPGAKYTLSGDAIVPNDAPKFGSAELMLHFFDNDQCSGPVIGGGSDGGGLNADERGEVLKLSVKATAPANATAAWVRPVAQKEPKAPANTAPGELIVAWDNISLTKQTIVVGPILPDLPIKDLNPGGDPPVDPTPPADEPTPPAVDPTPPADQPTPPADQPTPPADQPGNGSGTEQPSNGQSTGSGNSGGPEQPSGNTTPETGKTPTTGGTGNVTSSGAGATSPLPPQTGQGESDSDRGPIILGGALAAMLAGLGLVAVALRGRRRSQQDG